MWGLLFLGRGLSFEAKRAAEVAEVPEAAEARAVRTAPGAARLAAERPFDSPLDAARSEHSPLSYEERSSPVGSRRLSRRDAPRFNE